MTTDDEWEQFGASNPYYGVLTEDRYHARNLDESAKRAFFEVGEAHVASIFEALAEVKGEPPQPARALDFGCGVGRLSIPLSSRCAQVTSLDVSPSMLGEAEANCRERGIRNVRFRRSDDGLRCIAGETYDLIISDIVFQHIPVERGTRIYLGLLEALAPGGLGALAFTYSRPGPWGRARELLKRVPLARRVRQAVRLPGSGPRMEMNSYSLTWLVEQLQLRGVRKVQLRLSEEGPSLAAMLLFQRP